jgi:hypothetical protein
MDSARNQNGAFWSQGRVAWFLAFFFASTSASGQHGGVDSGLRTIGASICLVVSADLVERLDIFYPDTTVAHVIACSAAS